MMSGGGNLFWNTFVYCYELTEVKNLSDQNKSMFLFDYNLQIHTTQIVPQIFPKYRMTLMASMNHHHEHGMKWKNKRQKRWYSDSTWVGSPVTLPILIAHLAQSEQNSPKHMSRFTRKMHPGKINIVWKIFWKCFLLSLRTRRCNWSEVISMYSRQGRWSAVNLVGPRPSKNYLKGRILFHSFSMHPVYLLATSLSQPKLS